MPATLSPASSLEHEPHPGTPVHHPARPFRLSQRWSRLLFAHWPMRPAEIQSRLPNGLTVDTLDGYAWLGVIPFLMDRVRVRTVGDYTISVPGATAFPELNLRTYVRAPDGTPGVYFFSLDAGSLLAVIGARVAFGLPYFWARMQAEITSLALPHPVAAHLIPATPGETVTYTSQRRLGRDVRFHARYRSLSIPSPQDDLRTFLTERYALFVRRFGAVQMGRIHHQPWQLENAEAELIRNDLPASFGLTLPDRPPVLHYGPEVHMHAWALRRAH